MPHQYTSQSLTVLYCDLVDSTHLSRRLDPEDLREVVRAYQQASATIIARYRGHIAQYQGDALLVYFGYPQPSLDDAQRAAHTALGIIAILDDLNARLEQTHSVRIAVRIGIHTGPVVVAALGDAVRQEQLAMGETSTIAAGIQGLAAADSVVVTAATAGLLQGAFVCDNLGMHAVKGVTKPMTVLCVQAAHTTEVSPAEVLTPARGGGTDDAERRHLTVMFCDIADTARLSPHLTADALLAVVQAFQARCAAVVARYDGYIAQYLDNGLLIYFGFPHAHEDDAQRAVRAGLEIVEAMPDLNAHIALQVSVQVATRIGMYTGRAVAGDMGGGSRIEQLAVGDTPNVAARIHGLAEPNTVLLGATTARLVQGYFVCEDLGTHRLKGVAEPMPVVRVRAVTEAQTRLDVAGPSGLAALVGRERELQQLVTQWEQSQTGQGQVVLLSGEAGIGKSRIVETMRERAGHEGATWIRLRCSPYYQNSAFYPVVEHLRRALCFHRHEAPEAQIEKLQQMLAGYQFSEADTLPLLAGLLSLPDPGGLPPLTLSPQRRREKTQAALVSWLVEEAARQPTLLVWEDLHWVDPSTLELLGRLVDQVATARILLLLTYRPEFIPPWDMSQTSLTVVALSRLERQQVEGMIGHVTRGRNLPTDIVEQIIVRTDGIPLFVEELTKTILESGVLRAVDGHYELTGPASTVTIPETLQDSLLARLDRLGAAKRVAQVAAVIGREFSYDLLAAVSQQEPETLSRYLEQLVQADLVTEQSPQASYQFRHALIQDTAYGSLLRRTRQQAHQHIAQVLVEQFAEIVETQPEILAHHYTEANQLEPAVAAWHRAGQRAIQRSANVEAIAHLTKGLKVLETLPETPERTRQELHLQTTLGPALMAIKGYTTPEAEQAYTRALELCQQLGETPQLFSALRGLWSFYIARSDLQKARELGEQLLALAESDQDPALLLMVHYALGVPLYYLGELVSARTHLEQQITLYDPQQHRSLAFLYGQDPGVVCLSYVASALWLLGYPDQALNRSREAIALADELSHPFSQALALNFAAMLHQDRREGRAAQERAEAVIALSNEQRFLFRVAWGTILRGWALAEQGQVEEGIGQIRQGLAPWQTMGTELARPHCLSLLAEVYGKAGRAEEGLSVLAEALTVVHSTGQRVGEAELYRLKGELLLLQTPPDEHQAEACFRRALDIARRQQAKSWELRTAMSLSQLWQHQRKRQEARQLLAPIYDWFTEGFDTADLQEAKALLDRLAQ
jgi:class 3 adenylate cyclase/predicted ATPase